MPMAAQAAGARDFRGVRRSMRQGLWVALILALTLGGLARDRVLGRGLVGGLGLLLAGGGLFFVLFVLELWWIALLVAALVGILALVKGGVFFNIIKSC